MKVKYLFRSMLAMAGVFAATSCSQEELYTETEGDFIEASFTIETPDAILSRATIGDGTTVDQVCCAVFDANGDEMKQLRDTIDIVGKKAQYNVRLAKGQAYRVAFFAYDKDTPAYDVTDMKNIQVLGNQACNVEGRDAFTAYKKIEATTAAIKETVTLRRPFAQLNLGAYKDDVTAAAAAGIEVAKSKVTVTNVYTAFSAYDDAVVGGTSEMTFALNAIPTEALKVDVDRNGTISNEEEFKYLALNYILVGNEGSEKSLVDVTFEWATDDSKDNAPVSTFNNIPVQRNYRTNIVGSLLTNPAEFNIEIDARFDGDISESRVFNLNDLQAAIDNAPVGKTTVISLGANIKGDVIEHQKADRNIVIDGCGYKYDGTIKIHSGSTRNNGTITIKNVKFETSTSALNFIMPNDFGVENGVTRRYSNNIFVEDCTFTATGAAENTAVGVQAKSAQNVQVKNCTANGMHSLIQAQSCDEDVIVENATINGKNGVAFKQVKNAVVKDTEINATGYGIRFDGNTDNYAINAENINVTAAQPFIVRKMTGKDNTITLEGTNTLTVGTMSRADAPAYQIVITNGSDDEAYVKPTGTYTLTGADDFVVYPRDAYFFVATWNEFTDALAANESKIKLTDNIEYSANYQLQKDVVIDLNGKSMTLPMINIHKNVTIMNGTINGKMYARTGCKATLEGLTFSGTIGDDFSTEGHLQVQGSCDVYAKNCTFAATTVNGSQTRSLSIEGSSSGIRKFEGCDFKFVSWGTGAGKYKKNVYINTMNGTTTVDFTDCKFNGKAPNILFAAAYPLTNLTMSGCDNTAPTLEINRAKDTVTEVEWAHISSLIANNKFTQVRVFYAGGSSEYIR